ncbi:MAG: class I SAM-dependent methyltransferase [Bdellovibrionales bacterium]|nr:class I SAM-dependent methyltransferase [Bdellovibrionales bacterium]
MFEVFVADAVSEDVKSFLKKSKDVQVAEEYLQWHLALNDNDQLCLSHIEEKKLKPLALDFVSARSLHKMRSLQRSKQPLIKALGRPEQGRVYDLTAGFGGDLLLMLSAGFHVTAVESNPLVYLLLSDAVNRLKFAAESEAETIGFPKRVTDAISKLQVVHADSVTLVEAGMNRATGAVYLDPMFEAKKGGRLSQGPMQWMQRLVSHSEEGVESLVRAALSTKGFRVVIKRGLKADRFDGPFQHAFAGSSVRYDMYLTS